MSYYFKNIKPGYDAESDQEDDLEYLLKKNRRTNEEEESTDEELKTLSFGSLKKANDILSEEEDEVEDVRIPARVRPKRFREETRNEEDKEGSEPDSVTESDTDSEDAGFFEEDGTGGAHHKRDKKGDKKKKRKHAPTEQSSKKRVSKIRKIPGLDIPQNRNPNLYKDVRFDKSTGEPSDLAEIRRRYQFLDEYREKEIKELEGILKNRKLISKISDHELHDMEEQLKSMRSKLQTVKNKDLEKQIVKEYEQRINKDNKNKFHLKKNEKRKVIQKWKFDHMKANQREKVMERKRKKRLGKEFKQFEFHKAR